MEPFLLAPVENRRDRSGNLLTFVSRLTDLNDFLKLTSYLCCSLLPDVAGRLSIDAAVSRHLHLNYFNDIELYI